MTVIISIRGSSATFPVLFFLLFSHVVNLYRSLRKKRATKRATCNIAAKRHVQIDFARFIPLKSKVPNASRQVVTGGKTTTTKRTALPFCSNLSHHAKVSLHVKFDSKVFI